MRFGKQRAYGGHVMRHAARLCLKQQQSLG
jgi:hypothetical protein